MKILHCCLAAFYIDNFGYQENILPKMHKLLGHDVTILASTETYIGSKLGYTSPGEYINENGIPVKRIPYSRFIPSVLVRKLRLYEGIGAFLKKVNPDIIFLHDVQFLSIVEIVRFAQRNPNVKIYADGHTDFGNSAKNWVSRNILHKVIYKWCAKMIEPYVSKFWGVTPLRVDFFIDVYGINKEKVDLLVLGLDDSELDITNKAFVREKVRTKHGLGEKFVFISGGKIDRRKNIHLLLEAFSDKAFDDYHLILFGSITDEMRVEIEKHLGQSNITYLKWLEPKQVSEYFMAADFGVFPGTHSVLWEQAVGVGLPAIFCKWDGVTHVDVGGNCVFIESISAEKIGKTMHEIVMDSNRFASLRKNAEEKGPKVFSYTEIAKKSIDMN
ncbi:glycosyltransferase [Mariniradius saccharolyticus AK6]|uniref:Glycosyltransferase n=2 Tax=Mariniradius TaxID=1245590 RepID=M7X4Q8_9BACT|nr:glycosyltransferase [Mariniradius saccharolyticus AK6]